MVYYGGSSINLYKAFRDFEEFVWESYNMQDSGMLLSVRKLAGREIRLRFSP